MTSASGGNPGNEDNSRRTIRLREYGNLIWVRIHTDEGQRLAEFDTYWHEDPFRLDHLSDLKDYAAHSKAWTCASETLAYTHAFRDYLESGAADVVMLDLSWCGGLSEVRKIAGMAEAWHVPVAPHDCTGPVVYMASCHFSLHAVQNRRDAIVRKSEG